ncbi:MAG: purine-nucleoside phosphorylase [Gemmatimonadota bacterium]
MAESSATALMASLREAVGLLRSRSDLKPSVGLVLGTGLGGVAEAIDVEEAIAYEEIPHFPLSTLETHAGRLLLGRLEGVPVAAMQGRFHRYEGYSLQEVVFPVRVLGLLGVDTLLLSGAGGGLHPLMELGEIVVLDDHINLLGDSPLVGPNADELGPRFPDMSEPYDRALQERAIQAGLSRGMHLRRGVYAAVTGPNLETRAEYRMLRAMGADVVGMSTVPEVIAARHMGMRVLGLTIVTDLCFPDALDPIDVPTILRVAREAEPHLTAVTRAVVGELPSEPRT